jgi:hypothetical protein
MNWISGVRITSPWPNLLAISKQLNDELATGNRFSDSFQEHDMIKNLLDKVDEMIITGGMAFTFLKVSEGVSISDAGPSSLSRKPSERIKTICNSTRSPQRVKTSNTTHPEPPRAREIDLYKCIEIGPPSDFWALRCTLFKLIYSDDLYGQDELPNPAGQTPDPPRV